MAPTQTSLLKTHGGHLVDFYPIRVEEMPYIQEFCSQCCNAYRHNPDFWNPRHPIELECGHVSCISCVMQRVDMAMDHSKACRECYWSLEDSESALESGWDDLFRLLEEGRKLQDELQTALEASNIDGDDDMSAFNAQRGTDYSISELEGALQGMNLQRGSKVLLEDVLSHFEEMDLSNSRLPWIDFRDQFTDKRKKQRHT